MDLRRRIHVVAIAAIASLSTAVGCATPAPGSSPFPSSTSGSASSSAPVGGGVPSDGGGSLYVSDATVVVSAGDGSSGTPGAVDTASVTISPASPTVTVTITDGTVSIPTLQFTATSDGTSVGVAWGVDQGGIASITPAGLFTPTGQSGGTVNVLAGVGGTTISTTVTVVIQRTQNGFTGTVDLTGSGGYGGVGGEGPGGPVAASDVTTLQQTPTADPTRSFLYPYTGTVWPRGLLAPLLQWTQGTADATAIALHLSSKTYTYDGYFGRPAALAATSLFVRHPIPQDVWQQATESTAGDDTLSVSLVLLQGGAAVGPLTETWKVRAIASS